MYLLEVYDIDTPGSKAFQWGVCYVKILHFITNMNKTETVVKCYTVEGRFMNITIIGRLIQVDLKVKFLSEKKVGIRNI